MENEFINKRYINQTDNDTMIYNPCKKNLLYIDIS